MLDAVSGQLLGRGLGQDEVTLELGVDDLADDLLVGDSDDLAGGSATESDAILIALRSSFLTARRPSPPSVTGNDTHQSVLVRSVLVLRLLDQTTTSVVVGLSLPPSSGLDLVPALRR